jgi:hypothetical protein
MLLGLRNMLQSPLTWDCSYVLGDLINSDAILC